MTERIEVGGLYRREGSPMTRRVLAVVPDRRGLPRVHYTDYAEGRVLGFGECGLPHFRRWATARLSPDEAAGFAVSAEDEAAAVERWKQAPPGEIRRAQWTGLLNALRMFGEEIDRQLAEDLAAIRLNSNGTSAEVMSGDVQAPAADGRGALAGRV